MAGWASFQMAREIEDFFYRGVAISIDATLYMRLLIEPSSRAGTGTGTGTESNYDGYARLAFARTTGGLWTAASSTGQLINSSILIFPTASSVGNGRPTWFDFVNTASGSFTKLYNGGPINPPKDIVVGKDVRFRAGALVITF